MARPLSTTLVLAATVGAFFLGRWSRDLPEASGETPAMAASTAEADAADVSSVARSTTATRNADVASASRPAPDPGRMQLPHVPVSSRATGPQPLRPEDEPRLAKAERLMEADGGAANDLLDLSRDEEQDEQARQLEALIAQSILRNGGRYTRLRLSPPHCTRSVCVLRGIGLGHTQDPRSDWQRLSVAGMNEPWFREAFDDMHGIVTGDGGDTVYITLYVRCAPGTCLHARP